MERRLKITQSKALATLSRLKVYLRDFESEIDKFETNSDKKACGGEDIGYISIVQERIFFWTSKLTSHDLESRVRFQQNCSSRFRDVVSTKSSQYETAQFKSELLSSTSHATPNQLELGAQSEWSLTGLPWDSVEAERGQVEDLKGSHHFENITAGLKRR